MTYVLQCQKDIIVILPTGGGKSMLAIVPSLLEVDRFTVLVLPLNSLIMDYERRLTSMDVPYQIYQADKQLNLRDNLVLVSADKSQTASWRTALAELVHFKQIARIVVDEAHIPLIAKGYRKTLEHFYNIRSVPAQLVLLSATLPPAFMPQVIDMYCLHKNTIICRQGTNQPELKYKLEKTSKESDLSARTQEIVQQLQQTWQPRDRALVYVPSIDMCTDLALAAKWHCYVGDKETMTAAERQEAYMAWVDGKGSKVMVATSAFSTGNDYSHVRLVIHADKPFDMLEYVQGQGVEQDVMACLRSAIPWCLQSCGRRVARRMRWEEATSRPSSITSISMAPNVAFAMGSPFTQMVSEQVVIRMNITSHALYARRTRTIVHRTYTWQACHITRPV